MPEKKEIRQSGNHPNSRICRPDAQKAGVLLAALLGAAAFLIVYGQTPLHVTNDAWIMAGYDETDIIQHYSGWAAFRNSDWTFPLGLASDMAYGEGTVISFTDSIPWVAVFFKLFRKILPETFQYFGPYALLCYMLQAAAGYLLTFRKSRNAVYSMLGAGLFIFAPVFLERSLRHTALGSQWLLLFAIYVWLRHRDAAADEKTVQTRQWLRTYRSYLLLLVLAIGIHPYFLPMIAVFLLLCVLGDLARGRKSAVRALCGLAGALAGTGAAGFLLGAIGSGVSSSRDGYGYYSMNLNALWNPSSLGGYTWSAFLKVLPQTLGNYDGFNYLGVGLMAGIVLAAAAFILRRKRMQAAVPGKECSAETQQEAMRPARERRAAWIRRNAAACVLLALCTLFAVSNVVTWNDAVAVTIPLPEKLLELCGIFRASSRMFYPVYYCLMLFAVYGIWQLRERIREWGACAVLLLVLALQLFDIHGCIGEKHAQMEANRDYSSVLQEPELNDIMANTDEFLLDAYYDGVRVLSVPALKHRMKLYFSTANSGSYDRCSELAAEKEADIKATGEIGTCLILTSEWDTALEYLQHENIGYYERNGAYYLCDKSLTGVVTRDGLE